MGHTTANVVVAALVVTLVSLATAIPAAVPTAYPKLPTSIAVCAIGPQPFDMAMPVLRSRAAGS